MNNMDRSHAGQGLQCKESRGITWNQEDKLVETNLWFIYLKYFCPDFPWWLKVAYNSNFKKEKKKKRTYKIQ